MQCRNSAKTRWVFSLCILLIIRLFITISYSRSSFRCTDVMIRESTEFLIYPFFPSPCLFLHCVGTFWPRKVCSIHHALGLNFWVQWILTIAWWQIHDCKTHSVGAGEMAQLREPDANPDDLSSVSGPTWWTERTNPCSPLHYCPSVYPALSLPTRVCWDSWLFWVRFLQRAAFFNWLFFSYLLAICVFSLTSGWFLFIVK